MHPAFKSIKNLLLRELIFNKMQHTYNYLYVIMYVVIQYCADLFTYLLQPIAACAMPIINGMKILTESDKTKKARYVL